MFEVTVEHVFPAAHALRNYKGATEPTHGHNFRAEITLAGPDVNETGLLIDFIDLQRLIKETIAPLDHRFLNEVAPFHEINPSAENIARYLFAEINRGLPAIAQVPVSVISVRVWETPGASATYREFLGVS